MILFSINRLKSFINSAMQLLLFFIYPPYCAFCRIYLRYRVPLCDNCIALIQPVVSTQIRLTKKYSVTVFVVGAYKEPLRSLILAKGKSDIVVTKQLGQLIWDMTYIKDRHIDYLVPVPLHWSRYAWRGFNQAHEIAHVLSQKKSAPVVNLLRRNKKTVFQSALKGQDRAANVNDAFVLKNINSALYKDKHLVLVDDLFTTGATLHAAAKQLAKLKPASITAVVAARVV